MQLGSMVISAQHVIICIQIIHLIVLTLFLAMIGRTKIL